MSHKSYVTEINFRYVVVVHPFRLVGYLTRSRCRRIIAFLWGVSAFLSVPVVFSTVSRWSYFILYLAQTSTETVKKRFRILEYLAFNSHWYWWFRVPTQSSTPIQSTQKQLRCSSALKTKLQNYPGTAEWSLSTIWWLFSFFQHCCHLLHTRVCLGCCGVQTGDSNWGSDFFEMINDRFFVRNLHAMEMFPIHSNKQQSEPVSEPEARRPSFRYQWKPILMFIMFKYFQTPGQSFYGWACLSVGLLVCGKNQKL